MSVKGYYLFKVTSCPRCGLSGKVNDYDAAKLSGETQLIIDCPDCGGAGEKTIEINLYDALLGVARANPLFDPFPGLRETEEDLE